MRSVTISIVTPTLNSERFFGATLSSIHDNVPSSVDVQHIVVDGGSSDRTVEMAQMHDCEIVEGEDKGLYDAMNIGIRRAEGDIVAILNSDDILLDETLSTVGAWFRNSGRRSGWLVGGVRWIDAASQTLAELGAPPSWLRAGVLASLGWNCIHHGATFMTREYCSKVGEYDITYSLAADYEFLVRALMIQPYDRINQTLYGFRWHGQNATASGPDVLRKEGQRIAAAYGPRSALLGSAYRTGLRAWMNAANPRWFAAKKLKSW